MQTPKNYKYPICTKYGTHLRRETGNYTGSCIRCGMAVDDPIPTKAQIDEAIRLHTNNNFRGIPNVTEKA